MKGRVLIAAGSDSGGGAGIQADIKTVTALQGYAMTAITALTAQNTLGVEGILDVPADFVALQMRMALKDIGADCVKTGMLNQADVIDAIAGEIERFGPLPLVVDPVMVAKGGASLLQAEAVDALKARLVPMATVLTPNLPEAEALTGMEIRTPEDAARAGIELCRLGPMAVLVKGGHMEGGRLVDTLVESGRVSAVFESERIASRNTHGTGCTMASAIATGLAQGMTVLDAVARARAFVLAALRSAPGFGSGHGPLDHGHTVRPFDWS